MEVHVKVAGVREQRGQPGRCGSEMRVRYEYADLSDVDMSISQVQIHTHGAGQPPNDWTCRGSRVQMMDVAEADALIPFVVEDDDRLDRAILQDLDLRKPL